MREGPLEGAGAASAQPLGDTGEESRLGQASAGRVREASGPPSLQTPATGGLVMGASHTVQPPARQRESRRDPGTPGLPVPCVRCRVPGRWATSVSSRLCQSA